MCLQAIFKADDVMLSQVPGLTRAQSELLLASVKMQKMLIAVHRG
jgi:hypothetical protein